MAHLTKQAFAASTRKTYKIGIRSFLRFCRRLSLSPFPAEHSTVCLFATFLSRKVGYQTVKTYLTALSCWHKSNGYPDPAVGATNPQLQLIIRGIRRVKARIPPQRVRQPITISMLKHLCRAVPKLGLNGNDAMMFQAAMSFAFFGCLRISELTFSESTGRRDANPQLRDISVSSSSLIYHLRQSKTDQLGLGAYITIGSANCHTICPCRNMMAYLQNRQAQRPPSSPLFQLQNGKPLTRWYFVSLFKSALRRCGYNPKLFNSHSFRKGAASLAFQGGWSPEDIKHLGRWRSDAYRRYID